MGQRNKTRKVTSAEEIARLADRGEDVSGDCKENHALALTRSKRWLAGGRKVKLCDFVIAAN